MKKIILTLFFTFLCSNAIFSQTIYWGGAEESLGAEPINSSKLRSNFNSKEYSGVYRFGQSELESDFIIVTIGKKVYCQWKSGSFNEKGEWIWEFFNILNTFTKKGFLEGKNFKGRFVYYSENGKIIKGFVIEKSPFGIKNEFGHKLSIPLKDYILGNNNETYYKRLEKYDLKKISKKN